MSSTHSRITPGRTYDLLLLDFGGVCLLNPVELHSTAERALGLAPGTLDWMGPLDPDTDPLWVEMIGGSGLTEREYWSQRARDTGAAAGIELDRDAYMRMLYEPARADLVRPECVAVVAAAQRADIAVAVLTNDLRDFHGRDWEHGIPLLGDIDYLADCSDTGILKPDPRAYERALDMSGCDPDQVLFVDDQPNNVSGATALGIDALWFDIANAADSWRQVGKVLGLKA